MVGYVDPFIASWALMVIFLIAGFLVRAKFLKYLKEHHRETWLALGAPTNFLNNSIKHSLSELRFIFGGRFLLLKDGVLNRLSFTMIFLQVAFLVSFFVLIFLPYPAT